MTYQYYPYGDHSLKPKMVVVCAVRVAAGSLALMQSRQIEMLALALSGNVCEDMAEIDLD